MSADGHGRIFLLHSRKRPNAAAADAARRKKKTGEAELLRSGENPVLKYRIRIRYFATKRNSVLHKYHMLLVL